MLTELALIGGFVVAIAGWLEASAGPGRRGATELEPQGAIREAMRGPDGRAVAAEFRRRLVLPRPERLVPPIVPMPPL